MYLTLLIIFLLVAIGLIALIMLQQGKGTDTSTTFSAGISSTLFSSSGFNNFITRMTVILATLFFMLSLMLGNLSKNYNQKSSQWHNLTQVQQAEKIPVELLVKPDTDVPQ